MAPGRGGHLLNGLRPDAELISTGRELLNGRTLNRHAATLGEYLGRLGIRLQRDTTVPDDQDLIRRAVEEALARTDLVFVSGGLGPTSDDLTRDAVAEAFQRDIVMDADSLATIRERFIRQGRHLSLPGERQALVVEGAAVLSNRVGAAPGERIEHAGKVLFLLPGPPREFEVVYTDHIAPWLKATFPGRPALTEQLFMVTGMGEADVIVRFEASELPVGRAELAYCAAPGQVEIRLGGPEDAGDDVAETADRIRALLGTCIYAEERLHLEDVVIRGLVKAGWTAAVAESCTGGLLGMRLTSVPGASEVFRGGIIAYANEVKAELLRVPREMLDREGAVSEAVAGAMARGVRQQLHADVGLAITGVAGPGGGAPDKPVGTVCIAMSTPEGDQVERHRFPGDRTWVRERSALRALDMLRLVLPTGA